MQLAAGNALARVLLGWQRRRGPFSSVAGNCAGPLSSPPYLPLGRALLSPTLSSPGRKRGSRGTRPFSRKCEEPHSEATPSFGLLMRSQDGLHCETNSLSLRSGERVRERGAREIRDRFQAMFSGLSPLPGPLPARSSRGEGEDDAPPAPRGFVANPADSSECARFATNWSWLFVGMSLRACFKNPPKRRVRARGLQETMRFRLPCRPGPLTGRFSKHALRIAACFLPLLLAGGSALAAEVSFRNDVMAVLSKAGCSAGICHGNKNGKGGYKLSLRGQEPDLDYGTLTRESFGRRTNPLEPDQSLVLLKATAEVAHEGGLRLKKGSAEYEILRRWIAEGMPNDLASAPKLRRLEVTPTEKVLLEPVRELQLRAGAILAA